MTVVQEAQLPSGEMIMATARLLDENGEALYSRPVTAYMDKDENPTDTAISELVVYDPFTGIAAGSGEELDQLVCLTNNQGFVWVQITQPSMALFQINAVAGLSGVPLDSSYDIHAGPWPLVGVFDVDTQLWVMLDTIKTDEIIQQVPSTIGSFNRFELSGAAIPGKITVETLTGRGLQEFNVGGATLGVTFKKQNLPVGFFVYDHLSGSLFVSDDSVTEVRVRHEVPPFTTDVDTDFRPRKLIPNAAISAQGIDLATANLALYPDVRLYLQLDYVNIIRKTAVVVFQNPLSKLEESKRYAEG